MQLASSNGLISLVKSTTWPAGGGNFSRCSGLILANPVSAKQKSNMTFRIIDVMQAKTLNPDLRLATRKGRSSWCFCQDQKKGQSGMLCPIEIGW